MQKAKAQGALEYLLVIGGAVLVGALVIALIMGASGPTQSNTQQQIVNTLCNGLTKDKCGSSSTTPTAPSKGCVAGDCTWDLAKSLCTGQTQTSRSADCFGGTSNTGTSCTGTETQLCSSQLGVCAGSQQTCTGGTWPGCNYTTITGYEQTETNCTDGLDNDCDGLTDAGDPKCTTTDTSCTSNEGTCRLETDGCQSGETETSLGITQCEPLGQICCTVNTPSSCGNGTTETGETCGEPGLPTCSSGYTCTNCQCIQNQTGTLVVAPAGGLTTTGPFGGPFSPDTITFTLTNTGITSINWTAVKTQTWTTLSSASGTLAAGANTTVTVSINAVANSLDVGPNSDTVTFTNTTNGQGNTTRPVSLTVTAASLCGNPLNTIQAPEVCDGTALGDATCATLGFASGTLTCNADCYSLNTSACVPTPSTVVRSFSSTSVTGGTTMTVSLTAAAANVRWFYAIDDAFPIATGWKLTTCSEGSVTEPCLCGAQPYSSNFCCSNVCKFCPDTATTCFNACTDAGAQLCSSDLTHKHDPDEAGHAKFIAVSTSNLPTATSTYRLIAPNTAGTGTFSGTYVFNTDRVLTVCSSDSQCNDSNPNTTDSCTDPGTVNSACVHIHTVLGTTTD